MRIFMKQTTSVRGKPANREKIKIDLVDKRVAHGDADNTTELPVYVFKTVHRGSL